jgi:hypothetical protein
MGGQNKGDYASKMAIDSMLDSFARSPAICLSFSTENLDHPSR